MNTNTELNINTSTTTQYDEAVWTMLDPETVWPTLPENINPERGGPEAYFAECIRNNIKQARTWLAELERAIERSGWFETETDALDAIQEAAVGIEVAVRGRVILAHAAIADGKSARGRLLLCQKTGKTPQRQPIPISPCRMRIQPCGTATPS